MSLNDKIKTRLLESRAKLRILPLMPKLLPKSRWNPSLYLSLHASKRPNATAVKYLNTDLSWKQLDKEVNRTATAFKAMGVRADDKVAILLDNRPEFLIFLLALSRLQAVAVLLNTSIVGKSLAHCINAAEATNIVVGSEHVEKIPPVLEDIERIGADRVWLAVDPDEERQTATKLREFGYCDLDEVLQKVRDDALPPISPSIMDTCCYIYTSGTTGLPKAAIVTNQRLLAGGAIFARAMFDLKPYETVYVASPLYHSMGLNCGFGSCLISGASVALRRRFSASDFWNDVRKFDANAFTYVGELCRYLVNQPPSADDRNHNLRVIGGVGLRPDVWREFVKRFGVDQIHEMYGATEGAGGLHNVTGKVGMMGRKQKKQAIIRCDLETGDIIRNAQGFCEPVGVNETGLFVNFIDKLAPFDGYVDRKASEKKLIDDMFKKGDRYFNSGDLVTLHDDDWVSFADRVGDTFRWKGENVSTNEVAEVLNGCAGVLESNVYGVEVPHNEGRAGMASLNVSEDFDIAQLAKLVMKELAAYQRPYFIRLQKKMRLTQTFKHQKVDYRKEGFDPEIIDDELHLLLQGNYVKLDRAKYEALNSGEIGLR